ncbi:alkaline phosphatase [uncultured Bacteroides sp.]|uniref:alkaline phosphatase n=1 Tax=uncultured Bacteroides sp. TaxID=162156 RepID=UPI002AA6FDF9|nr:alkaline phosphatase [uncultured Bacteroides sp.]
MIKIKLLTAICIVLFTAMSAWAQVGQEPKQSIHSHNDYLQNVPFYIAYGAECASIEADVFVGNGELYVAHEVKDIDKKRTLKSLYLDPLKKQMEMNGGMAYVDGKPLQLVIDLKTGYKETLQVLLDELKDYAACFDIVNNPSAARIVITGNQPAPALFQEYPEWIFFDGRAAVNYTPSQSKRIAMVSMPFTSLTEWNGLGRMVKEDYDKVKEVIDKVHADGKQIRFWGCPDTKTAWNTFIKMGVDYLNTDRPAELSLFLNTFEKDTYVSDGKFYTPYQPTYETDEATKAPKNVIVLISDGGAGVAEMWAAATANGGLLNVLQMKNFGLLRNDPLDDYTTDSAGSGTALATGVKTRNRRIGTDEQGKSLANITEFFAARGKMTGIISNDQISGATPASYYAHQPERGMSEEITKDLLKAPVSLVVGAPNKILLESDSALVHQLRNVGYKVFANLSQLNDLKAGDRAVCLHGDDYEHNKRLIEESFDGATRFLSTGKKGFFLMIEGAKIDTGGHTNDMHKVVDEYLSFDRMVGKALAFADRDKETLVLVLSDHETGGLSIIDGNYEKGSVLGSFATHDHTGIPILLFAYGPCSSHFKGFAPHTSLPKKIEEVTK